MERAAGVLDLPGQRIRQLLHEHHLLYQCPSGANQSVEVHAAREVRSKEPNVVISGILDAFSKNGHFLTQDIVHFERHITGALQ